MNLIFYFNFSKIQQEEEKLCFKKTDYSQVDIVVVKIMVAYFCHHLSDFYVDLSVIHLFKKI